MKNFFSNKIFYPEGERIIRGPLDKWEEDLRKKFEVFLHTKNEVDFLLIINQASLVSAYLGQSSLSYQMCSMGILYFLEKKYLEGVFQPWINIGRLHIIQKKFNAANNIFNKISPFSNKVIINSEKIPKGLLKPETLSLIKNCYFYEKVKIFLNDYENTEKLFTFSNKHKNKFKELRELFLEAEIIALLIMDEPLKALKKSNQYLEEIKEHFIPLFLLRTIDIYIYMKKHLQEAKKHIHTLYDQHIAFIHKLNIQGLYFCLEICKRLKILEENFLFIQMSEKLIKKFKEIQEEAGLIEVLYLRKDLSEEYKADYYQIINITKYSFLNKISSKKNLIYPFSLGEDIINFLGNSDTIFSHSKNK